MEQLNGTLSGVGSISGALSGVGMISGAITGVGSISGGLSGIGAISGALSGVGSISGGLTISREGHTPPYEGAYEYTPSAELQTIEIKGKRALQNITINPIPSNYGLVTWDGSILTVS